jgi:uncharacterized lipoprotein YajG
MKILILIAASLLLVGCDPYEQQIEAARSRPQPVVIIVD